MKPKITPDLQFSVVCDDVRQERNGKFILIGLFDLISGPQFPVNFPRICVVNRWCGGEGGFRQLTRIVRPDQSTILTTGREIPINLPSIEATVTNIEFFVNVGFPEPGAYWVEILLEQEPVCVIPLRVAPAQPSAGRMPPPAAMP